MKRQIPKDFTVTDAHRQWAVKRGYPLYMPDQWVYDFKEYFELTRIKHIDWSRAFYRYIRMNAPSSGKNSTVWERRRLDAKQQESEQFKRSAPEPYYDEGLRRTPMPHKVSEVGQTHLAKWRLFREGQ